MIRFIPISIFIWYSGVLHTRRIETPDMSKLAYIALFIKLEP